MWQRENNHSHKPIILQSRFLISVAKKALFQAKPQRLPQGPGTGRNDGLQRDEGGCYSLWPRSPICGLSNYPGCPATPPKAFPPGPAAQKLGTACPPSLPGSQATSRLDSALAGARLVPANGWGQLFKETIQIFKTYSSERN